jgi:WD40 repeat protein
MVINKTKVVLVSMVILILSCGILPFSLDNTTPISLTKEPTPANTAAYANPLQETPSGNGEVGQIQKIASNNVTDLKEKARISIENPAKIVWFSDGSRMAVVGQNKLNIVSAEDLVSQGSFEFSPPIFALAFSPDGHTVASTSDQISLELREAVDGRVISTLHPSGQFLTFDFSPDGKYLLTGSVDNIAATIWDISSGQIVKELNGFKLKIIYKVLN